MTGPAQPTPDPTPPRGGELTKLEYEEHTVTLRCTRAGCENEFSRQVTFVNGRPFGIANVACDACLQADSGRREREREQRREMFAERRAAEAVARAERAMEALAVPPKYAGVTLEPTSFLRHGLPEDRKHQDRVVTLGTRYMGLWPDVPPIVLLRGGWGTGKGHWIWSIALRLVAQGIAIRVVKLADMIRRLRAFWGMKGAGERQEAVLSEFRTLDLLAIDEVSRHAFYGQQIHQHLYDVIDHRLEHLRPTIISTNEEEAGIRHILGGALYDRVAGDGWLVEFGTASWRTRDRDGSAA